MVNAVTTTANHVEGTVESLEEGYQEVYRTLHWPVQGATIISSLPTLLTDHQAVRSMRRHRAECLINCIGSRQPSLTISPLVPPQSPRTTLRTMQPRTFRNRPCISRSSISTCSTVSPPPTQTPPISQQTPPQCNFSRRLISITPPISVQRPLLEDTQPVTSTSSGQASQSPDLSSLALQSLSRRRAIRSLRASTALGLIPRIHLYSSMETVPSPQTQLQLH
jgi:hypothetical protein